ncbi:Ni,Fe-hydrogenase I large subunit [Burkholderiales bacterium JOSHI_001]|nr:Ni,Fe-hydrogenase I large subunit [Burkholderiales bacterium JOSHI_001]
MTSPAAAATLAGRYTLRPGCSPSIEGGRPAISPEVLQRLAQGKSAPLLPALLGSVFTLCGHAHRIAAGSAVRAAQGDGLPLGLALRQRLQAETAREHLQRMALDWPQRLTGQAQPVAWLSGCPLFTHADAPGDALAALAPWMHAQLLGEAPQAWWDAWCADGEAALLRWCARRADSHPVARLLHDSAALGRALGTEARPWLPLGDAETTQAHMRLLAAQLQQGHFVQSPVWQGYTVETGPWTRRSRPVTAHNAWMRLASRLVDLVHLALPDSTAALAHGAWAPAPGEGIAWVEMARGLLVHWVRLDERQRVADVRVLAPTEWNLHPQGVLAQALAALPANHPDTAAQARLLATAFDPCVDFEIDTPEPAHA